MNFIPILNSHKIIFIRYRCKVKRSWSYKFIYLLTLLNIVLFWIKSSSSLTVSKVKQSIVNFQKINSFWREYYDLFLLSINIITIIVWLLILLFALDCYLLFEIVYFSSQFLMMFRRDYFPTFPRLFKIPNIFYTFLKLHNIKIFSIGIVIEILDYYIHIVYCIVFINELCLNIPYNQEPILPRINPMIGISL